MAAARQYRALLLCGAAIVAGMSMSSRDSMAQMSFSGAKEEGKALGTAGTGAAQGNAVNPNLGEIPGYTTSNPPQTGYNDANMYDAGVVESQTNEAAQLLHGSFANRPHIIVEKTDPWLQKGWDTSANPQDVINDFTGSYEDCEEPTSQYPGQTEYRTCTVWENFDQETCSLGQIVEVSAGTGYACYSGRGYAQTQCDIIKQIEVIVDGVACTGGTLASNSWGPSDCRPGKGTNYRYYSGSVYCSGGLPYLSESASASGQWPWSTSNSRQLSMVPGISTVPSIGGGSYTLNCSPTGACTLSGSTGSLAYHSQGGGTSCQTSLGWTYSFQLPATYQIVESEVNQCTTLEELAS